MFLLSLVLLIFLILALVIPSLNLHYFLCLLFLQFLNLLFYPIALDHPANPHYYNIFLLFPVLCFLILPLIFLFLAHRTPSPSVSNSSPHILHSPSSFPTVQSSSTRPLPSTSCSSSFQLSEFCSLF